MTYFVCARATEHDAGWKLNASLTHAADRELTRDAYHPGVGSAVHRQRNDVAAAAAAAGTHEDAAAWAAMDSWSCDMWLTPGSVVMHSFSLRSTLDPAADPSNAEFSSAPGGGEDRLRDIASLAKSAAKGKLFEICSAEAGDDEEPHIFLCKGGLTVRLHCDGTTTPVLEIDPAFRARTLSSCHATCSSPSVRWTDITVPGVPRGIKFEGRFHGSTLLRVEELSRCPSSNSSSTAAERREDVRIRVHLPGNPLGAARVEAVWAEGACRNLIAGAGFPILLVPAENIAEELRTRLLGPSGGGCGVPPGVTSRESTRGFVQQAGHALHAALRKHPDQGVAQQTAILHNAAGTPRLPLFSALLRFAADYLDHALELQDIDEMLAEEAAAEADMKRQSFCKQEKAGGGAPPGGKNPEEKNAPAAKTGQAAAAGKDGRGHTLGLRGLLPVIVPHHLYNMRLGVVLTAIFLTRTRVDYHKLVIYVLCFFLSDMVNIPAQVFSPVMKDMVGSAVYARILANAEHRFFTERVYKAASFYSGSTILF